MEWSCAGDDLCSSEEGGDCPDNEPAGRSSPDRLAGGDAQHWAHVNEVRALQHPKDTECEYDNTANRRCESSLAHESARLRAPNVRRGSVIGFGVEAHEFASAATPDHPLSNGGSREDGQGSCDSREIR